MMIKPSKILILLVFSSFFSSNLYAVLPTDQRLYDMHPWGVMAYFGMTTTQTLQEIVGTEVHRAHEKVYSLDVSYTLDPENCLSQWLSPFVNVVQVAANGTLRNGKYENAIYEFDPYVMFRWVHLPWDDMVVTTLALGEGISYASSVPPVEKNDPDNSSGKTKRLLNYLAFEATFAFPDEPQLQFVARIHHRSGAFGLYGAGNSGSNVIGIGIRYLLD